MFVDCFLNHRIGRIGGIFASTCHWWAQKPVTLVGSHVSHSTYFGVSYKPQWNQFILDHFYGAKNVHSIFFHDLRGRGGLLVGIRYQLFGELTQEVFHLESNAEGTVSLRSYLDFIRERRFYFFTFVKGMKIKGIFRDPQGHGTPLFTVSFPYELPISLGILMGVVWE